MVRLPSECDSIVQMLVTHGADVNAMDKEKMSPLAYSLGIGEIFYFKSITFRVSIPI